jgi:hypothetical protein
MCYGEGGGKCNIMYHECEMENEQYGDEPELQNMPNPVVGFSVPIEATSIANHSIHS